LKPGQTLLVGGYRWTAAAGARHWAYNSMAAVRRYAMGLAVAGFYDKYRLVPFGEFMPLDSLASRLGVNSSSMWHGFAPGPEPRPCDWTGLPAVQPLICYESLFPALRGGAALSHLRPPGSSWFPTTPGSGSGSGPPQLAQHRQLPRHEEGLPMVPGHAHGNFGRDRRLRPDRSLPNSRRRRVWGYRRAAAPGPPAHLYFRLGSSLFC